MTADQTASTTTRRNLMRAAALATVVGGIASTARTRADAAEGSPVFPEDFQYAPVTGPAIALWGSSSFQGARATEGVATGFDARVSTLLSQHLGMQVLNFGRGGETSHPIVARRGVPQMRFLPVFPGDMIPAEGSVEVTLEEGSRISWGEATYAVGYVLDVPCTLQAVEGKEDVYLFTRLDSGSERYCPPGIGANRFLSYQEQISRSAYHVLQIGRNNVHQPETLKEHTAWAFDLQPKRSLVMGHFRMRGRKDSDEHTRWVLAYNEWAAATYGAAYLDVEHWLRERSQEGWLRYGDLAGSGVWNSDEDQKDYEEGLIPRSLYATDGLHLNGWGYLVLARALEAKAYELGWVG